MPDMAEEQALIYLHTLTEEIREVYRPGVRLTICSDGHVFSDLVGVSDDDVTRYGEKIREMIAGLEFESNVDTFALPDLYDKSDYSLVRRHLIRHYAQSPVAVRERAGISNDAAALINGIHRFLFEDQVSLHPELSRSRVRSECRSLAYEVVQRSDAWGRLLSDCFPMALRLSIHPQNPHSEKIGILLGPSDDIWLTPWHAVAVKVGESFKLMHRRDAEEIGAGPVTPSGFAEPYYYELRN